MRQDGALWVRGGVDQLHLRVLQHHHGPGLPRHTSCPVTRGGWVRPRSIALTLPVIDGGALVVWARVLLAAAAFQGVALPI